MSTAGPTESRPEPRSALARWAGRGALALLAASAGLAGFVVAEELLPDAAVPVASDPLQRLKNRSAADRVARLKAELAEEMVASPKDLRDGAAGQSPRPTAPAEPVSLETAAGVLDKLGDELAAVPAPPEEPVTLDEAANVLDQLAEGESTLPPAAATAETGASTPTEAPSGLSESAAVEASGEMVPPVPGDSDLEGGVSRLEAAQILDQLAEGAPLPELPPAPTVQAESSEAAPSVSAPSDAAPAESTPAEPTPADMPTPPEEEGDIVPAPVGADVPETDVGPTPAPAPEAPEPTPVDVSPSTGRVGRPHRVSSMQFADESAPDIEPVRDPSQLKKLGAILPYSDYEPDPEIVGSDRCQNLCPRPGDKNCPDCKPGMSEDPNQPGCPECPEEVSLNQGHATPDTLVRSFPANTYHWEAPNVWHYPLYFEDVQLERYGHSRPWYLQPFISTARMSGQLLMGPYQMALLPPWKKDYGLGYYRPGSCAPYRYEQLPWNARAASVQAGAVVGGYFLFAPTP